MKNVGLLSLIFFAVTGMAAAQQNNVSVVKKPQVTDMDQIQSDILHAPKQKPLWRGDLPDITKQLQAKPSPAQDSDQDISPDDDNLGQQSAADDNTDNASSDQSSQNSQLPVTDTDTSENTQAPGVNTKNPQSTATPAITLPVPSANAPDHSTESKPPAVNPLNNSANTSPASQPPAANAQNNNANTSPVSQPPAANVQNNNANSDTSHSNRLSAPIIDKSTGSQ